MTVSESAVCPPGLQDKVVPGKTTAERIAEGIPQVITWSGLTMMAGGKVSVVTMTESVAEQPFDVPVAVTI